MLPELLKQFHTRGATIIVATHDQELIRKTGGRVIHLNQGQLHSVTFQQTEKTLETDPDGPVDERQL